MPAAETNWGALQRARAARKPLSPDSRNKFSANKLTPVRKASVILGLPPPPEEEEVVGVTSPEPASQPNAFSLLAMGRRFKNNVHQLSSKALDVMVSPLEEGSQAAPLEVVVSSELFLRMPSCA